MIEELDGLRLRDLLKSHLGVRLRDEETEAAAVESQVEP
jgi:hypothetical protein